MIALVDGDLVAYRCAAFTTEEEGEQKCFERIDHLVERLLHEVGATEYRIFLSCSNNFRKIINPEYKANRKDMVRPPLLKPAQQHLVKKWKAEWSDIWLEADDMMGLHQTNDSVIVSLDKDLRMIPGKLYSWEMQGTTHGKQWTRPATMYNTTYLDGLKYLYKQSLIGDNADNIVGVHRVGEKKAAVYIDPCETEQEMFDTVRDLYNDDTRLIMNLTCLWILQWPGVFYTTRLLQEKKVELDEDLLHIVQSFEKQLQETVNGGDSC